MNFLAHAYLAGTDDGLIAGGVLGDWVKGPLAGSRLAPALLRGVALHRAIDAFAETHPAFRRSRARVAAERRRWAGVLVDMYYDHLLAAQWPSHHALPLPAYTRRVYAALAAQANDLPAEVRRVVGLMADEDWLASYASPAGLEAVLGRMGRRVRRPNPLGAGVVDLLADGPGFGRDFAEFLPAARAFAEEWISRAPPSAASA